MQHVEVGDLVKFLGHLTPEPPNPVTVGEEGVVISLSGKSVRPRQFGVTWDSGRTTVLYEGADRFEIIKRGGTDG